MKTCESLLYASNSSIQAITAAGGIINFGSPVRKFGRQITLSGGNVVVRGADYYTVDVNLGLSATAAGAATVTVYANGTPIPGANAVITTTVGGLTQVVIPTVARDACGCEEVITVEITGEAINVTNAAIRVLTAKE